MATKAPLRKVRTADPKKISTELESVLSEIRKRHGEGTAVFGSAITQPYRIPLGIFPFDFATLGGIPANRIIQFDGAKHSGKTTAALKAIRGAQQSMPGKTSVLLDIEGTYDDVWARKNGVDTDQLVVVQPDSGEHAVDLAVGLIHAKETSLLVADSLAALLPLKEQDASAEDSLVGQQSRLITSFMRKASAAMIVERKRGHAVTLLLINQQRAKIGGWAPPGGEALSNPGGKAVGFFTSLETRWKNKEVVKKDEMGFDSLDYNEHAFSIQKNKLNGGIRSGEFRMLRRDDESIGLLETEVDDAPTMVATAKRFEWMSGSGRSGYELSFADITVTGARQDDIIQQLREDKEAYWALRCELIATHAERMGMKPEFINYLRGTHG